MSKIADSNGVCTQITIVKLEPGNQQEVLNLMPDAHAHGPQPGFVPVIVHRNKEGSSANGVRAAAANSRVQEQSGTARSDQAGNGVATTLIPALDRLDHFTQPIDLFSFFVGHCARRIVLKTRACCLFF